MDTNLSPLGKLFYELNLLPDDTDKSLALSASINRLSPEEVDQYLVTHREDVGTSKQHTGLRFLLIYAFAEHFEALLKKASPDALEIALKDKDNEDALSYTLLAYNCHNRNPFWMYFAEQVIKFQDTNIIEKAILKTDSKHGWMNFICLVTYARLAFADNNPEKITSLITAVIKKISPKICQLLLEWRDKEGLTGLERMQLEAKRSSDIILPIITKIMKKAYTYASKDHPEASPELLEEKTYSLANNQNNEKSFFYKQVTILPRKFGEHSNQKTKSITWEELCNEPDGCKIAANLIADAFLQQFGIQEHYQWINERLVQSGFSESCTVETVNWTPEQLNQIAMTRIPPYNSNLLTHLTEEIIEATQNLKIDQIKQNLIKQINEKVIKNFSTENISQYLTQEAIDGESGLLYFVKFGSPEILTAMIEKLENIDQIITESPKKNSFAHAFLSILNRSQNENTLDLWQPIIEIMIERISPQKFQKWLLAFDKETLNTQFHVLLGYIPQLLPAIINRLSPEACQTLLASQNEYGKTGLEMAITQIDDDVLLATLMKQANNLEFIKKLIKQTDKKFAARFNNCLKLLMVSDVNHHNIIHQLASNPIAESKPRATLIAEYKEINPDNSMDAILLGNQLDAINEAFYSYKLAPNSQKIAEWNAVDIKKWAYIYNKNATKNQNQNEIIAVIIRGVELIFGYRPRDTQIMALCALLYENSESKGTLGEIATGEGKSLIVAMQSLFLALQGHKVDVYINSSLLAIRDCQGMQPLYQLFGVSAATNCDPDKCCGNNAQNTVYDSDVVYGDITFQHDYLREARNNRPYDQVIVDEIDNLFIDGMNDTAILSEHTPGTEHLRILQVAIWHRLQKLDAEWYTDHGTPHKDLTEQMRTALRTYLNKLIYENIAGFSFPKHLTSYIEARKDDWVDGAIDAMYHYQEDHHYVISTLTTGKHSIAPVLHSSTGIVLPNNVWFAVHPFLELKHGLRMSSDTIHTSFISNLGYFQLYRKITGVTGTPGNTAEQEFLQKIYSISCTRIPAFTPNKFEELPGKLSTDWLNDVVFTALQVAASGRPVLILCETIAKAKTISQAINLHLGGPVSHSYTRNDTAEKQVTESVAGPGVIIPTTLLGTRGMDLKTSVEAEKNGGLFVLFSFLPTNARVQRQGFGRTARNGQNGSGQLIADRDETILSLSREYPDFEKEKACDLSLAAIYQWRDLANQKRLEKNIQLDTKRIALRDSLYTVFTRLMKEKMHWANHVRNTGGSIYSWTSIKNAFPAENPIDPMRIQARLAFGLWLDQLDKKIQQDKKIDETAAWQGFFQLQEKINQIYQHPRYFEAGDQIINPYLSNPGPLIIQSLRGQWSDPLADILILKKCISLDPIYSVQAHYHLAFSLINMGMNGLRHLYVARELLTEKIIPTYQSMLLFYISISALSHSNNHEEFTESLQKTMQLLCLQVKEIDLHLNTISGIFSRRQTISVNHINHLEEKAKWIGLDNRDFYDLSMSGMLSFHTVSEWERKLHNQNKWDGSPLWYEYFLVRETRLLDKEFSPTISIAGLFNYEKSVQMVTLANFAGNAIQCEYTSQLPEEKDSLNLNSNHINTSKHQIDITIARKNLNLLKKLKNDWLTEEKLATFATDLNNKITCHFNTLASQPHCFPVLLNLAMLDRTETHLPQKLSELLQLFLDINSAQSLVYALIDGMVQQTQSDRTERHLLETSEINDKLTECVNSIFTVFWNRLELLFGNTPHLSHISHDHPALLEITEWLGSLLSNQLNNHILENLNREMLYPASHLMLSNLIRSVADNLPTEIHAELIDQIEDSNTFSVQTDEYLRGPQMVQIGGMPAPLAGLSLFEAIKRDFSVKNNAPWQSVLVPDQTSFNPSFNDSMSCFVAIAAGDESRLFNIGGHRYYSESMLSNAASFGMNDGLKNPASDISQTWQDINGTTRLAGGIQCVAGVSSAISGGVATATFPVAGQILGPFFAAYGIDNAVAGCTSLVTGIPQATIMNGILQNGAGLSPSTAFGVELGLSVGEIAAAAPILTGSLTTFSMFAKTLARDVGQTGKFLVGPKPW